MSGRNYSKIAPLLNSNDHCLCVGVCCVFHLSLKIFFSCERGGAHSHSKVFQQGFLSLLLIDQHVTPTHQAIQISIIYTTNPSLYAPFFFPINISISSIIRLGASLLPNLLYATPSWSIRNFPKFQRTSVEPSSQGIWDLRKEKTCENT